MGDGRPPSAREMGDIKKPLSPLLSLILTSRLTGMTTGLHSLTEAS
jgi:hypothetical protein